VSDERWVSPADPGVPTDTKAESQISHGFFLMYYGSEFTSNHYDAWARFRGIDVDFIRSGKPVDNAHIGSFNGRLRAECLNSKWFESLDDAGEAFWAWRRDYNEVRPHSLSGDMPPSAFAKRIQGLQPDPCSRA
jgi:putative transposase